MEKKIALGGLITLAIAALLGYYWISEPGHMEAKARHYYREAVMRGAELFAANCTSCHGRQGEGMVGPPLRDTQLDEETLSRTISRGIPNTAMPRWGEEDGGPLKKHQIDDLVLFLVNWDSQALAQALSHLEAPGEAGGAEPSPTPVPEGASLYTNLGCAFCHGPEAQGAVGPHLAGTQLSIEAFTNQLRNPTGGMPPFRSDDLSDQQLRELFEWLKSLPR